MTKQQKIERIERDGYRVVEHPKMTVRYTAVRVVNDALITSIPANSISGLFKQIYGY